MRFIVLSLFWCSDHSGIDLNQPIKHICIGQSCCKSLPEPMEFPHLGRNCSHQSCNKLDFLPVRCDACEATFCIDHYSYTRHNCSSGLQKDVQVPVCPLCMEPVPTAKDVSPDVTVSRHIDQFCKSDTRKIYTNQCSMRGCKKKELIPVLCTQCKRNFCLTHRHTTDHKCDPANAIRDQRANAAQRRINQTPQSNTSRSSSGTHAQAIQGTMTEDEALAHAIALSMQESQPPTVTVGGSGGTRDKCRLS